MTEVGGGSGVLLRPESAEQAQALRKAHPGAVYAAGLTVLQLGWGAAAPTGPLIDISRLPGLVGVIETPEGGLRIGALTPLETVRLDPLVRRLAPALADLLGFVGGLESRLQGTIGGNVAWASGDLRPLLLAYDARTRLADGDAIPLDAPIGDALALSIEIPPQDDAVVIAEKVGVRAAFSPAIATVAIRRDGAGGGMMAAGGGLVALMRLAPSADADDIASRLQATGDAIASAEERCAVAAGALAALWRGAADAPVRAAEPVDALSDAEPEPDNAIVADPTYLTDRLPEGVLIGATLRSPHAHAEILEIDVSAARDIDGVVAVVTAEDIPGERIYGIRAVDRPYLCWDRVRHIGDPIAAVAAETRAAAEAALAAIKVTYRTLPAVTDPEAALAPDAPTIHPEGNLCHSRAYVFGDVDAARAKAAHVVETVVETGWQAPAALELEGGVAVPDGNALTVYAAGHWPHAQAEGLAAMLGRPAETVRIVSSPIGGSFGGKDDFHVQPVIALLAQMTGRPVRQLWSRAESFAVAPKRHPARMRMRTSCTAEGDLLSHELDLLLDTGAYAAHGPEVLDTALQNALGGYAFEATAISGRLAYTNNGVSGAFRGFGIVQSASGLEQQIEALARRLGLDPIAFRRRNLRADDATGPIGQELVGRPPLQATLDALEKLGRRPRPAAPPSARWRYGRGSALIIKNDGVGKALPQISRARLTLREDGRIEAALSLVDMGQGVAATVALATRRALGVGEDDVVFCVGDSATTPDSGPTIADRGVGALSRSITLAAPDFERAALAVAAERLGEPLESLALGPGGVWRREPGANGPVLRFADLAAGAAPISVESLDPGHPTPSDMLEAMGVFVAAGAMAELWIDSATGRVVVEALDVACGAGPVVSPRRYRAQLEGGLAMGLGFALTERLSSDGGRFSAANLDAYLPPTFLDAPRYRIEPVEALLAGDPVEPRGVGEVGVIVGAAAIGVAASNVIGAPVAHFPLDAAALRAALRETAAQGAA